MRQTTNVNFRVRPSTKMFLPHIYIIGTLSCIVRSQHIFSGMDELDQVCVDDIAPGGDVVYSEAPYITAVFNALVKYQTCSGFIIHRHYVLAAGYCVMRNDKVVDPHFVSVLAGVYDFRDHQMDQWRYAVRISEMPKTYMGRSVFVLIRVNEGFFENFSCNVIRHKHIGFENDMMCNAISWRFHDKLNRLTLKSLVLKKHQGYVLNKTNCIDKFQSNPILSGVMSLEFVCMVFIPGSEPSNSDCMGADGSSLICKEKGVVFPAGIATNYYGFSKCNRFEVPNIFLDVGAYSWWIDREMEE